MPMELRLAQVLFPFEKEMQIAWVSKEDKDALFGRRMTVIVIFVKFLADSASLEDLMDDLDPGSADLSATIRNALTRVCFHTSHIQTVDCILYKDANHII